MATTFSVAVDGIPVVSEPDDSSEGADDDSDDSGVAAWCSKRSINSESRPTSKRSQIDFMATEYSDSAVRYFAAEFVGTFILTLLSGLFMWGIFYHQNIQFQRLNNARSPTLHLDCAAGAQGNQTCTGYINNPLAGSMMPGHMGVLCLFSGFAFSCVSMLSPGATFNASFTLMLCVGGLKRWSLLLPSLLAQFVAVLAADWIIFFLLLPKMGAFARDYMLTAGQVLAIGEVFFGVSYPNPIFDNYFVFCYAVIANVIFVFLMLPMGLRCMALPTMPQEMAKGVVIGVFGAAFGVNGLGALPNPSQWLGGAVFLDFVGSELDIWTRNNHYAFKVPLFAPTVGIFLGSFLASIYIRVLYHKPAAVQLTKPPDLSEAESE